ncbi:MAG: Na+/H+ antiporter NhaC family protein [Bacteroidaceae bacterium]|nr:Na+/H+ antiporter NhaC family protein [Bacteroidaceae bacterium]
MIKKSKITPITKQPSLWALSPLLVFLCMYLVVSLLVNDFYKVPITVAFLTASVYAVCITKGLSLNDRIMQYSQGAANKNVMLMIWIFVLAGAFAQSAKDIGAIDATVNLTLQLLPGNLLLAGFFLAACFISLSIGTSVGTIVALVPVIVGIAEKTGMDMAFMTAIVVGGAFFGDNLSFISDTTIAATRTQGCAMKDKFKVNFRIVLPAAMVVLGYYIYRGYGMHVPAENHIIEWVKVLPYLVVLLTAFLGFNVALVLFLGIITSGIVGLSTGTIGIFDWFGSLGTGISGMGELIIITLMAGGMLELIRFNGGVDYIIHALTRSVNGKRGAEMCIAALVSIANVCTANNTIAIITVGPLANDIASRYGVDKRKSASILDTFSCVVQGIIPYGAQMLIAAKLASLSPLSIVEYLYYPLGILAMALFSIFARWPKKYS